MTLRTHRLRTAARQLPMLAALALAGCDVKMEDGTTLSPGQRVAVTIMCPGTGPFDGWLKHPGNLTTADGVGISGKRCVWMRRGSAHSGD